MENKTFSRNFELIKDVDRKNCYILYVPTYVIDEGNTQKVSVSKAAAFSIDNHCTRTFHEHKTHTCTLLL